MPNWRLKPAQLLAHANPQERVERRKRLVEQQHRRIGDEGAGECDALLLAAGKLRRQPLGQHLHLDQAQHLARLGAALRLADAAHPQAKRDVVDAVKMREQCIALEHHCRAPPRWRQIGDANTADRDFAASRDFMTGDHPERRGLPAARRSQQAAIGSARDRDVDRLDGNRLAEALGDAYQLDIRRRGHSLTHTIIGTPAKAPDTAR